MANSNFVVQNGLTVGPLTIDATTGDINTSGNVNITGNLGVSQIAKNDSSVSINDTGTGSTVVIKIDGATNSTFDLNGLSIASGDFYSINGASVLTATTLGSAVVNSSLTSLGTITALTATTALVTNFSTGNARVSGGYITGLANIQATNGSFTTELATNFSTANALITGGGINGLTTLAATTGVVANFSSGNAVVTNLSGTTGVLTNLSTGNARISGGYITGLSNVQATNGSFTTELATNFSTANAVITGGSVNGLTTLAATTGVVANFSSGNIIVTNSTVTRETATNFSTANALITGGSVNGLTTLAATTGIATNFSSGNVKINGVESVGAQTGALQVTGGIGVSGNLWIGGNLYVSNIYSVTTSTLEVNDPLVYFVSSVTPYNFDIGFYSDFVGGPVNVYGHTGMVRQQSANTWVFFSNVKSEPTTTNINWADAGIIYDAVKMGSLILANTGGTALSGTTGFMTNFSSGNAVISGGSANGLTTLAATTGVIANFSSGNARITAGYADNFAIGANTAATGRFTTLTATGNTAVTSTVYTNGLYDSGNRVLSTSSGAGNLAIVGTEIDLTATGPGAVTTGSSTAIPVVTTDTFGRVAGITTAAVVAPAGTLSGTTLNATVTASSLTSVGTLTTLVSGTHTPSGNLTANLGSTTAWWNIVYGKAIQAQYADLAENYQGDKFYPTGTVLMFGGAEEVTVATADTTRVAGVVSSNPAYLMNSDLTGPTVVSLALTGRVPCNVIGPVAKGDIMVSAGFGHAKVNNTPQVGTIIGKALQDFPMATKGMIEVVVGRF